MTINENSTQAPAMAWLPLVLDIYGRGLAAILMFLGLRQWAVIIGIMPGEGGMFEAMSTPWQLATMHLAVVDLVASVGLWQRVAWGNVVWIYAALAEIAMHTVFVDTFGPDTVIVAFHGVTIAIFLGLILLYRRSLAIHPARSSS